MTSTSNPKLTASIASKHSKYGLTSLLAQWWRNHHSRKALGDMEKHHLHDIGVDPAEAEAERRKPFWR
ncbi:DUF1127 domain-containing protein [Roseovarius arcticus]|uniref:DUF1127 domain-containing protein n=1 Tax=Roseovarius arcticus TaxID=2547404 RepID=UPI001110AF3E|nr:DUF1127 domain-containing protein [Roseovarius arcticus]